MLFLKIILLLFITACGQITANNKAPATNVTNNGADTCNNPDAAINCCFVNMPAALTSTMVILAAKEEGDPLLVTGTFYKQDGKTPYANVLVYGYQTDAKGYYSKSGSETGVQKWHGRLHGWCKTNAEGKYQIQTIRPAPYPGNTIPAHIHLAVKEPNVKKPYYISDIVFEDDPLVNDQYLHSIRSLTGGTGIVALTKDADGRWKGKRDIILPQ